MTKEKIFDKNDDGADKGGEKPMFNTEAPSGNHSVPVTIMAVLRVLGRANDAGI